MPGRRIRLSDAIEHRSGLRTLPFSWRTFLSHNSRLHSNFSVTDGDASATANGVSTKRALNKAKGASRYRWWSVLLAPSLYDKFGEIFLNAKLSFAAPGRLGKDP